MCFPHRDLPRRRPQVQSFPRLSLVAVAVGLVGYLSCLPPDTEVRSVAATVLFIGVMASVFSVLRWYARRL